MKTNVRSRLFLLALFALFLAACGSAGSTPPIDVSDGDGTEYEADTTDHAETQDGDASELPEQEADTANGKVTVHVYSDFQTYLYYSQDTGVTWVTYPGNKMGDEGTGWYVALNIPTGASGELHFVFNDGATNQSDARWIKPKGQEDDKDAHFIVAAGEYWIKDGELSTNKPDVDGDGAETVESETDAADNDSVLDGDTADNDTADNDVPDGDTTDSDSADNDTADNDTTDNDTTDSDTTDNDTTDNDSTDSDSADGDSTDNDSADNDTAEAEQDEAIESDPDVEQPPTQYPFTIHLYSSWAASWLRYRVDSDGTDAEQQMQRDDKGWLSTTAYINWSDTLWFTMIDKKGGIVTPIGSTGPFSTKISEVWIMGGMLYDTAPEVASYTVHLFTDWFQPYLFYSSDGDGNAWTADGGEMMNIESEKWWRLSVAVPKGKPLIFLFNNGGNLNDASNWYHPYGQPGANFSTGTVGNASEVWIKDGNMSTTRPGKR